MMEAPTGDSVSLRVLTVLAPRREDWGLADARHFLCLSSADQALGVLLQQKDDLLVRETFVYLSHGSLLKPIEGTNHRCPVFK